MRNAAFAALSRLTGVTDRYTVHTRFVCIIIIILYHINVVHLHVLVATYTFIILSIELDCIIY